MPGDEGAEEATSQSPTQKGADAAAECPTTNTDVWTVSEFKSDEKAWSDKNNTEKASTVALVTGKCVAAVAVLYVFILSLGLMGDAFKILGGKEAGRTFRNNETFDNPFACFSIGLLTTILVQSSSTSTSIIISMTAADILKIRAAIFMIMGANVGTTVTNTIVSFAHIGNRAEYRRGFAAATVHDCFNLLTVCVLLPLEAATTMLESIASSITDNSIDDDTEKEDKIDFLKKITKPVTSRIVAVNKDVITDIAEGIEGAEDESLLKNKQSTDHNIFMDTPLTDAAAGWILLFVSLGCLTLCLVLLVKLLQSIFKGRVAIWMRFVLNLEFRIPEVGNYVIILFGCAITILMQSSSVTTSTLTPLVAVGLLRLDKMFPFTVGANVGTTVTGILSALASSNIKDGMTVALAHLFFNLFGAVIWFPLPFLRAVPISMSKFLGNVAADVRSFPIIYTLYTFVGTPVVLLGLSLASPWAMAFVGGPFLIFSITVFVVAWLRVNRAQYLPKFLLGNPQFLPPALLSGAGMDGTAEDQEAASGHTDMDLRKNQWWQAPFAWASGWLAFWCLLMAVPNAQYASMKYAAFDGRDHVGLGGWHSCSSMYKESMQWSPGPVSCNTTEMEYLAGTALADCGSDGFADAEEANAFYEDSWAAARSDCETGHWLEWCLEQECSGLKHAEQCYNVSDAVAVHYEVSYGPSSENAWNGGDMCRANDGFTCDNEEAFQVSGRLGLAALIFGGLGQICLLSYLFARNKVERSVLPLAYAAPGFLRFGLVLAVGLMGTPDQHFLQHSVVHRGERG